MESLQACSTLISKLLFSTLRSTAWSMFVKGMAHGWIHKREKLILLKLVLKTGDADTSVYIILKEFSNINYTYYIASKFLWQFNFRYWSPDYKISSMKQAVLNHYVARHAAPMITKCLTVEEPQKFSATNFTSYTVVIEVYGRYCNK